MALGAQNRSPLESANLPPQMLRLPVAPQQDLNAFHRALLGEGGMHGDLGDAVDVGKVIAGQGAVAASAQAPLSEYLALSRSSWVGDESPTQGEPEPLKRARADAGVVSVAGSGPLAVPGPEVGAKGGGKAGIPPVESVVKPTKSAADPSTRVRGHGSVPNDTDEAGDASPVAAAIPAALPPTAVPAVAAVHAPTEQRPAHSAASSGDWSESVRVTRSIASAVTGMMVNPPNEAAPMVQVDRSVTHAGAQAALARDLVIQRAVAVEAVIQGDRIDTRAQGLTAPHELGVSTAAPIASDLKSDLTAAVADHEGTDEAAAPTREMARDLQQTPLGSADAYGSIGLSRSTVQDQWATAPRVDAVALQQVVSEVRRTLAVRDLQALDAGRSVSIHLPASAGPVVQLELKGDGRGGLASITLVASSDEAALALTRDLRHRPLSLGLGVGVAGAEWSVSVRSETPAVAAVSADRGTSSDLGNGAAQGNSGFGGRGGQGSSQPDAEDVIQALAQVQRRALGGLDDQAAEVQAFERQVLASE